MELKQLIKLQTARQRPGVLIGSSELKFAKSTPFLELEILSV